MATSENPDLPDEAAIDAVSKWRFSPATRNGVPTALKSDIKVTFALM